jgi:hypothetical protein
VPATSADDRYRTFAITCPFHGNAGWRWIRDNDPDGWAGAVEFDRAIRYGPDIAPDVDEDGDPDGCSPWSCRSGEPVTATSAGKRAA